MSCQCKWLAGLRPLANSNHSVALLLIHGARCNVQAAELAKPNSKPARQIAAKAPLQAQDAEQQLSATVFVRDLPADVTQSRLHARLAAFGSIASCRCWHTCPKSSCLWSFVREYVRGGAEGMPSGDAESMPGLPCVLCIAV